MVGDTDLLSRPSSLDELEVRSKSINTNASVEHGLAFKPRPSDVFISPFPKCGTTWTQQIVYGLRTRGRMDFREITEVTPWLEMAQFLGLDLEAEQTAPPRAYKSHLTWDKIPKGARYIYVIRDPKDALVSNYRFAEGWFFETGSIPISEYADKRFLEKPDEWGYWMHLRSWWTQRDNSDVLFLCYEDMKADLSQAVRSIASFLGIVLDDELLEIVLHQSSLAFMQAHKDQFDDHLVRSVLDPAMRLPPGSDSYKVRNGQVGDHRYELPLEISTRMDQIWQDQITTCFG